MLEIQKKRLMEALRVLDAFKGEVAFAAEFEGQTYGNRELKPVKQEKVKTKRGPIYPYGEVAKYVDPYLDTALAEGAVAVPWGPYDPASLRGNISARCVLRFGTGKANVMTNTENKTIEVLVDLNGVTSLRAPKFRPEEQIEMFDDGPTAA